MRFSTPKTSPLAPPPPVHALRDALLAGLGVMAAIILGAGIVYQRAYQEKIEDLQSHLGELASRLARLTSGPHHALSKLRPEERAGHLARHVNPFLYIRDHSGDTRRIYTFSLNREEPLTLVDTGPRDGKVQAAPLSAQAQRARAYYNGKRDANPGRWFAVDGLEVTAFAPIFDADKKPTGAFAIEADSARIVTRLAGIQESFLLTCLLGVVAGFASGTVVWRLRLRSARAQSQIEETRRIEQETLRLFFDETATAHFALDGDTLGDANPAAVALFGAPSKEALLARQVWELWPRRQSGHALSVESWSRQVLTALESGVSHFEWQFARFDGSVVDCDVFLRHTLFQDRDVLLVACYDLSPTKRAQAQLIESEQRFRDVSEAIGEFVWEIDEAGRYTYTSRRVFQVLGVEPEAVRGRTPFEFVPEEDRAEVVAHAKNLFQSSQPFRNFEHRVRRADGSILWLSVSGIPTFDGSGRTIGFRGASLDISSHRNYEQELVLQKEAAEAADRAKSNFLAMMSHEIRTPLNSVLGFTDLLLKTPLDASQLDHLRTIRRSGDALLYLLNDILDFSKIESGRMEVEIVVVDLPRSLREIVDLYQPAAAEKQLALRSEIAPEVPRHILTDPSRLRQILVNLVGNAVKFTRAGEVRIGISLTAPSAGTDERRLHFLVTDTGIGITAAERERLFQPFTQADSSTTRRFGGTGLGLAISQRLATLLGGELGLASPPPDMGSAFFLDLPLISPTPEQISRFLSPPETELFSLVPDEPVGGPAIRVLIVDDNTLNLRLTSKLLEQLGAITDVAASAEECFAKIQPVPPDLILMDVQMPGTDGLEAARRIREQEAGTPERPPVRIVALTADAMIGDRERCLAAGMNDYLTKPLRRDELARVLREARPAKANLVTALDPVHISPPP